MKVLRSIFGHNLPLSDSKDESRETFALSEAQGEVKPSHETSRETVLKESKEIYSKRQGIFLYVIPVAKKLRELLRHDG